MDKFNSPQLRNEQNAGQVRRFVHQPLTVDHHGTQIKIQPNGKVVITKVGKVVGEEVEYDEIEVPASLIFKVATLLTATRTVTYVNINEATASEMSEG